PRKLDQRRAGLVKLSNRKLLQIRADVYTLEPERLHPLLDIEVIVPAVKPAAHPPGPLDHLAERAITAGNDALEHRSLSMMHLHIDTVAAAKLLASSSEPGSTQ